MNKTKNRRRRGFTLIEMIVVIAIIAVLIALVAPLMTRYITNAKELRYKAAAKELYTAGQAYVAEVMLNGYADCENATDENGYSLNGLNIFGNGTFSSFSTGVQLDDYLEGEVPGDRWFMVINHFDVKGVTIYVGDQEYAYPNDFDWSIWFT